MEQENLIRIMPNTYICKTQAGWRKLLKELGCYGANPSHSMEVCYQPVNEDNAFEMVNMYGHDRKEPKQYPIKYPALVSFQDETFEISKFYMYIIYITQETCDSIIKDSLKNKDNEI